MARQPHASFFEYSITRAYPYRWFTPVAVLGGAIAVVLISLLNFVSSGYILNAQFSQDPNITVINARLTKWPGFLTTRLQPSCSSSNIPLNTQLFTNNSALTYTLDNVVQNADQANRTLSSSLIYHNNVLPDCTITNLVFRLDTQVGRTTAQIALSRWGIDARASVTCNLATSDAGLSTFNLTAQYDYMPNSVNVFDGFTAFVGRDKQKKAGLYWGESMLSEYWLEMARVLEYVNISASDDLGIGYAIKPTQGFIQLTPSPDVSDIKDPNFFTWLTRMNIAQPTGDFQILPYENLAELQGTFSDSYGQDFLSSADSLAKGFWSTILTDLGQAHISPNIFTDADLVKYFTNNFTYISDGRGQPSQVPYGSADDNTPSGPLVVNPSTLAAIYLCQVPQRKPVGSLILAILIADLVFLRALWAILTLSVSSYLKSTNPTSNLCGDCRQRDGVIHNQPEELDRKSTHSKVSLLSQKVNDPVQREPMYPSGISSLSGGYGGEYGGYGHHSHAYEMVPMESHHRTFSYS